MKLWKRLSSEAPPAFLDPPRVFFCAPELRLPWQKIYPLRHLWETRRAPSSQAYRQTGEGASPYPSLHPIFSRPTNTATQVCAASTTQSLDNHQARFARIP